MRQLRPGREQRDARRAAQRLRRWPHHVCRRRLRRAAQRRQPQRLPPPPFLRTSQPLRQLARARDQLRTTFRQRRRTLLQHHPVPGLREQHAQPTVAQMIGQRIIGFGTHPHLDRHSLRRPHRRHQRGQVVDIGVAIADEQHAQRRGRRRGRDQHTRCRGEELREPAHIVLPCMAALIETQRVAGMPEEILLFPYAPRIGSVADRETPGGALAGVGWPAIARRLEVGGFPSEGSRAWMRASFSTVHGWTAEKPRRPPASRAALSRGRQSGPATPPRQEHPPHRDHLLSPTPARFIGAA